MRYSLIQVDLAAYPEQRQNIGLIVEDDIGRFREIRVNKDSLGGREALGETTLRSLEKTIETWYDAGEWKKECAGSFLEFLHKSEKYNLHFSCPEPVPKTEDAFLLLYKARVLRQSRESLGKQKNVLTTRALSAVLLLYAISLLESVTKLRLQKIVYLAELSQETDGRSGLKYGFFKYYKGPFSKEIYAHLDLMEEQNLVRRSDHMIYITDQGKQFLNVVGKLINEHPGAAKIVRETVSQWKEQRTQELIDAAYSTPPMNQSEFIDDLLPFVPGERFSCVPTAVSQGLISKLESTFLSTPRRRLPPASLTA